MGSPRLVATGLGLCALAVVLSPGPARADEVIEDPELAPSTKGPKPSEEVIADPELTGGKGGETVTTPTPRPSQGETTFRVVLQSRAGVDTAWDRAAEDILEGTTIAVVEAQHRKSESLLFSVGLRARHAYGMRHDGSTRYELDAVPVSAFVDTAVGDSVHARIGYQTISMGRFDLWNASNFLTVVDLRSGPVTMPDALDIAQPALRVDWDPTSSFTLQAFYVPFFQPNLLPVYGTDYSVLDRSLGAISASNPGLLPSSQELERVLGGAGVTRSGLVAGSTRTLGALAPAPDFTTPQGALRGTFRGTGVESSVTVGTALERIPAVYFRPGGTPRLEHGRFYVASVDAALDAGPFQLGAEVAFTGHRTLATTSTSAPAPANFFPQPDHANLVHGGLRAELLESSGFVAAVEVFAEYATNTPSDRATQWYTMESGRYWRGVAAGMQYAPENTGLRLELGGLVFSGPTLALMPRAQYQIGTGWFLEAGAAVIEGPAPSTQSPMVSLGGIFDDVDQAFVGVRWVP